MISRPFRGATGVYIGVYQWYLIMHNGTFQYKTSKPLSQDKKRGFGFYPTFAESPCAGFEVQGPHQQPNASRTSILNTDAMSVKTDLAYWPENVPVSRRATSCRSAGLTI
jgi:hypothetical protein